MLRQLQEMAAGYAAYKPENLLGKINLSIGTEEFCIVMDTSQVTVTPGHTAGEYLMEMMMNADTFKKLADGTWNGITAAGRERMSQPAPLDFKMPPGKTYDQALLQSIYNLGMHFFHTSVPHIFRFGLEHSRLVHGGHATPLAYGQGVRFAHYTIKAGEQINDDGDTNPFDQLFTVIAGTGVALIGGTEVQLEKGMAVHVAPGMIHVVRATGDQPLEILWLAYGKGA